MNAFQFASERPFTAIVLVYISFTTLHYILNRMFRCLNVRKQGWPPPHLDADGDFKPAPEKDAD